MDNIDREYERTLEMSFDAIISVDGNGLIRVWNRAAERIFGYSKEEAMGAPVEMIIPVEYRERHREGFKGFSSTGRGRFIGDVMEVEGLRKDGSRLPIELSLTSIKINEWYATAVVRDITERKKLEDALERKFEETERMNRLMVGRELKIGEMKREIERLKAVIGEEGKERNPDE